MEFIEVRKFFRIVWICSRELKFFFYNNDLLLDMDYLWEVMKIELRIIFGVFICDVLVGGMKGLWVVYRVFILLFLE